MKKISLNIFFLLTLLSCKEKCKNSVSISLYYIFNGDRLNIQINNETVIEENINYNYSYSSDNPKYLIKDYCTSSNPEIKIRLNDKDTVISVKTERVIDVVIGQLDNKIKIHYNFKDGTSTIYPSD